MTSYEIILDLCLKVFELGGCMGKEILTGWKDCGKSVQDYNNKEQYFANKRIWLLSNSL
jgi:hypothetical protein